MLTVETALKFATEKHMGQVDKSGAPYIALAILKGDCEYGISD